MFASRFSSSMGLVGIDFGSRGFRMLQLREQAGGLEVVGAGRHDLPHGDDDPAHVTSATVIKAAFTNGGFTGRRCVICLPRERLHLQSMRLPKMPEDELRQAAQWEAAQRFGLDRNAMEVDFVRTGVTPQGGEGKEEVLIVAASHEDIHAYVEPMLECGLRPIAIDTGFMALARALSRRARRDADLGLVRAVVNVGLTGTSVVILRGDRVVFCKPIDVSGRQLNQAVAEHLELDIAAAAELRAARIDAITRGRGDSASHDPATDRAVYEAVRPHLGTLAKEVVLCLRYYGVTFRGGHPKHLIVVGDDGMEPHLGEMLEQSSKVPVFFDADPPIITPLLDAIGDILGCSPGPAAEWAAAAGLSLRNIALRRPTSSDAAGTRGAA